jgi:NAD(P)-dependent dehydrogenase (short-subunit alcohol dehydrogenase family)
MKSFDGKVGVITGAGSGIGRALALELAGRGARLAVSDINADNATVTAAACAQLGVDARGYALDVAQRDTVESHAESVMADFGQVNLVVNNAGVGVTANFLDTSWEDWDWLMGIDFWGVLNGSKAFLPHLIASGDGHLVNVSSIFGLVGVPTQTAYNAAKFAVRGLTEALAQEMANAGHPVKVSCVHPGVVKTTIAESSRVRIDTDLSGLFDRIPGKSPKAAARTIVRGIEKDRLRILIGPDAHAVEVMHRLLGPRYTGLIRRAAAMGGM